MVWNVVCGFFNQFLNPSLLKFCVCFLSWQGINPNFFGMGMKAFTIFVLYVTNKCSFIFVLAREFDRLWKNEKTIHCPLQIIICMVSGFNPFYVFVLLFGNDMSMIYTDYVNTKLKFWHLRRRLSILFNEGNLLFRPYNYQYNETNKINHIHLFCFTDAIPYTGLWYFKRESGLHAQITLWLVQKKCLALYLLLLICIRLFSIFFIIYALLWPFCKSIQVPSYCYFVMIIIFLYKK